MPAICTVGCTVIGAAVDVATGGGRSLTESVATGMMAARAAGQGKDPQRQQRRRCYVKL